MPSDKSGIIDKAQKLAAKGQLDQAIVEWQKLIQETPNDGNIYNTIGDLNLKKNTTQKAVEAYLKAAEAFQEAGFELKAIAVLKKIIKIDSSRLDVYERLADLNALRGLNANAIEEYHRLTKQYAKLGNMKGALGVYQKIVNLDNNNVQARLKLAEMCVKEGCEEQALEAYQAALDFYRSRNQPADAESVLAHIRQIRPDYGVDEKPVRAEAAMGAGPTETSSESLLVSQSEPPVAADHEIPAELAEPMAASPTQNGEDVSTSESEWGNVELQAGASVVTSREEDGAESGGEAGIYTVSEDEDVPEAFALDPSGEPSEVPQAETGDGEGAGAPIASAESDDRLNAEEIQNRMMEGEVYLKYGLMEKAKEQYLQVVQRVPDSVDAYLHLKEIYKSEGDTDRFKETCRTLSALYENLGEEDRKKEMVQEIEALQAEPDIPDESPESSDPMEEDLSLTGLESEGNTAELGDGDPDSEPEVEDPFSDQLAAAEGYLQRGQRKEARRTLIKVLDSDPDHVMARKKLLEIEEAEDLEATARQLKVDASKKDKTAKQSGEKPPAHEGSFDDIGEAFDHSFSILDAESTHGEVTPEPVSTKGKKGGSRATPTEDEDGSVDLSSLLDGIDDHSEGQFDVTATEVESELDTIFEEFQKGYQDQPSAEDVETHFNLGIAYREMGLFDDAITEFNQAMSGDRYTDAALMLVLCYNKKGLIERSETLLRSLLTDTRCSEEQQLLIKYELGTILGEQRKHDESQRLFREVYSVNPKFRDVASKVGTRESGSKQDPASKAKRRISYL